MYCSVEILADCDKYLKNNYFSTKYRIISQEIRDNLNTDFFVLDPISPLNHKI